MRPIRGALTPRRFLTDMAIAFSIFTIAALLTSGGTTQAATITFAGTASKSWLGLDFLALAGVFSVLLAFNMAFFRHLRQAYTAPRRRTMPGRGGPAR